MTYQLEDPGVFRAISDPTRRAILDGLHGGGRRVHEIAADFEVSRPAISQHLKVLLEAGLVREQREGRCRVYALDVKPLAAVDGWLARYRETWERNLESLRDYVEAEQRAEVGRPRLGARKRR